MGKLGSKKYPRRRESGGEGKGKRPPIAPLSPASAHPLPDHRRGIGRGTVEGGQQRVSGPGREADGDLPGAVFDRPGPSAEQGQA